MPITPTNPKVIPEVSLDKVWIKKFGAISNEPEMEVKMIIELQAYAVDEDGKVIAKDDSFELEPLSMQSELVRSAKARTAYAAVLEWVDEVAKLQGKL